MAKEKQTLQEQLLKDITALLGNEYLRKWAKKQKTTKLFKELTVINLEQYY